MCDARAGFLRRNRFNSRLNVAMVDLRSAGDRSDWKDLCVCALNAAIRAMALRCSCVSVGLLLCFAALVCFALCFAALLVFTVSSLRQFAVWIMLTDSLPTRLLSHVQHVLSTTILNYFGVCKLVTVAVLGQCKLVTAYFDSAKALIEANALARSMNHTYAFDRL